MCRNISAHAHCGMAAIVFASMLPGTIGAKAADEPAASARAKAVWQDGSARHDFVMDEQTLAIQPLERAADDKAGSDGRAVCILVVPRRPASGNPWSWRDLHRDHQPPAEAELLARGFHLAFITPGSPRQRDAWLAFLTEKHRLSRRPVCVGMSAAGELRAGTAKASITPADVKMPVHDACYARSLVLDVGGERIAIVAVNLGIYTSEHLVAACKERFGISHLVLSSSHTHSGPGRNRAAFLEERIIGVVEAAVKDMFPRGSPPGTGASPNWGSTAWSCARTGTPASPGSGTTTIRPRTPSGSPSARSTRRSASSRSRICKAGRAPS